MLIYVIVILIILVFFAVCLKKDIRVENRGYGPEAIIWVRGVKVRITSLNIRTLDDVRTSVFLSQILEKKKKIEKENFIFTKREIVKITRAAIITDNSDLMEHNLINVNKRMKARLLKSLIKICLKWKYIPLMLCASKYLFLFEKEKDKKKFFLKTKKAIRALSKERADEFEQAYYKQKIVKIDMWGDNFQ